MVVVFKNDVDDMREEITRGQDKAARSIKDLVSSQRETIGAAINSFFSFCCDEMLPAVLQSVKPKRLD